MINRISHHPRFISQLIKNCNIPNWKIIFTVIPYYFVTIVFSFIDGISMVLLVGCFTSGFTLNDQSHLPEFVISYLKIFIDGQEATSLVGFLIILFFLSLIFRIGIYFFDGFINAWLRQKLQINVFHKYLQGDWAHLRSFRVGEAVGITTLESMTCAKYLTSALTTLYYLLSAAMMAILALLTSFKLTIYLAIIVFPFLIIIYFVFRFLAKISKKHALLRNLSSGNITDRFNGLLQIHIDDNVDYHKDQGMRQMPGIMRLEVLVAICQSIIGSFNIFMALVVLSSFIIWAWLYGFDSIPALSLIASIGILGFKFAGHLNSVISMIGNLTRLSGSVYPVLKSFNIPLSRNRIEISNKVIEVELKNIDYYYDDQQVIRNISFRVMCGSPTVLFGRSGGGKTTIANLVSGLYFPSKGTLNYVDFNGKKYPSEKYSSRVGFVTQDVYFFQGTFRENLVSGRDISDEKIWSVLRQVDAEDFVKFKGGLDAESVESGRSLSGGQRRRIGIASVILKGADILIFDEITAGLDSKNRKSVISIISHLSKDYVVLLISHEKLDLPNLKTINI